MSVAVAEVHRSRLDVSFGGRELIVEYRVLANRERGAYLAVVTIRCASEIPPVRGPASELEPEVVHVSVCRAGSERETPRGRCRSELEQAVSAAALAEHGRAMGQG